MWPRMRPPVGIPCPVPWIRSMTVRTSTGRGRSNPGWPFGRVPCPPVAPRRNVAREIWRTTCGRSAPTRRARTIPYRAQHPTTCARRGDLLASSGRRLHRATRRRLRARSRPPSSPVGSDRRRPHHRNRLLSPGSRRDGGAPRRHLHRAGARSSRRSRGGSPRTCRAATPPDRTTGRRLPNAPTIPGLAVGARISTRSIRTGIRLLNDPVAGAWRVPSNPLARPDRSSLHWVTRRSGHHRGAPGRTGPSGPQ